MLSSFFFLITNNEWEVFCSYTICFFCSRSAVCSSAHRFPCCSCEAIFSALRSVALSGRKDFYYYYARAYNCTFWPPCSKDQQDSWKGFRTFCRFLGTPYASIPNTDEPNFAILDPRDGEKRTSYRPERSDEKSHLNPNCTSESQHSLGAPPAGRSGAGGTTLGMGVFISSLGTKQHIRTWETPITSFILSWLLSK